ncbi:MAG: glycosyltransferase family 39 protein [Anaerolineae bacterium]|nr:glycosyltransferase family 39 protein [Anaerolineae bacterium]
MLHDDTGKNNTWPWMLAALLLVCLLTVPRMDNEAFYHDEGSTLFNAGALSSEPWPFSSVLEKNAEHSRDQALGWPVLVWLWGQLVGWSEAAIRALPLLASLLSLVALYRVGSDLFSPFAGLLAAFLLAGSSLFLVYAGVARAFTLVTLFAALSLWFYWRVALRSRPPGIGSGAGLFLSALGLLYSHYFGALLLPALSLYHLLFVRKSGRWWRTVLALGCALLLSLLQLPVFVPGINRTLNDDILRGNALDATELLRHTLFNLANGLVQPGPVVSIALLLFIPAAILLNALRRRGASGRENLLWLPVFTAFALLWLMLLINALFGVVARNRIRYLMSLWPLTALSLAATFQLPARQLAPPLLALLLALWTFSGFQFSQSRDYRVVDHYLVPSQIHYVYRVLDNNMQPGDLLLIDLEARESDPARHYDRWLSRPYRVLDRGQEDPLADILPLHARHPWVWLLYRTQDRDGVRITTAGLGRTLCDVAFAVEGFTLERLALPGLPCPQPPARFDFGEGITLAEPDVALQDERLLVDLLLHSNDAQKPYHFSVSLQLYQLATQRRVAQQDLGIGPGNLIPLHGEIDIGPLSPGEYALRIALYNWESGERKVARDLVLGHVSDFHTLQHIFLD